MFRGNILFTFAMAMLFITTSAFAQTSVTLTPVKDNTLYETDLGVFSNGAGFHMFAGRNGTGNIRRALTAFDVAGSVPGGSIIDSVTLSLFMSRTISGPQSIAIHRVLADWGEGTSDADGNEGGGAPSSTGDATWIHTFYNSTFWSAAGGDFLPTASATQTVGSATGFYTWGSTGGMVSDVQHWLDNPAENFGWILIGNEASFPSTKRFDTRENDSLGTANDPTLTVYYSAPGGIPCDSIDLFQARCRRGGLIQARIVLLNSTQYAGEQVILRIDATDYPLTVQTNGLHSRALVEVPNQLPGNHRVTLVDPAGCFDRLMISCTDSSLLDEENWDWAMNNEVGPAGTDVPSGTALIGNYPNPFNPATTISYSLGSDARVSLKIYDTVGREVATLVDGFQAAGSRSIIWDGTNAAGRDVAAGVYVYMLRAGEYVRVQKMILLR